MIYATATFWLLTIVLLAWGIERVWTGMTKPRTLDIALLPGTLVAHLGHTVGLLITGASADGGGGQGGGGQGGGRAAAKSKLPIIGPVIAAIVPIVALGLVNYIAVVNLGGPVVAKVPADKIAAELPATMTSFWDQLVGLIRLAEGTLNAVRDAEAVKWQTAAFVYLIVCLSVRLAPFPGNVRGHVGAVVVLGIVAWLAGSVATNLPDIIRQSWPMLSVTIGGLALLLMFTLVVRATVEVGKTMIRW
jgi:hypothetical protein